MSTGSCHALSKYVARTFLLGIFDFPPIFWYVHSHTNMQCTFCNIVSGKLPAEILYQNDQAISILDINPIHYGHALVIPKVHCETYLDLPEETYAGLGKATKIVAQAIVNVLQPPGFNIFSNNGKAAGQSVFHFHFHITPRYDDDNIRFVLQLKKYQPDEMAAYAKRLRNSISTNPIQELI